MGKYPFRKVNELSRESIAQIIHLSFRFDQLLPLKLQNSLVPHCFRGKSAFFYNNVVVMVTIETPGFKRKRLLTLDKNFLVPSTISLNPGNNYAIVITIDHDHDHDHHDLKFCNKRNF